MAIIRDTITKGESYDISVVAKDVDGALTDTTGMTGAIAIRSGSLTGEIIYSSALTLTDGAFVDAIDTGDAAFVAGTHIYDIRLTDSGGNDYFSLPVQLIINASSTANT